MVNHMKKTTIAAACLLLFLCPAVAAEPDTPYSWYFKPASNGERPQVIPEAADFLEKHAVICTDTSGEKVVYLTFDAGYANENVVKILDVLKQKDVPAAFFVLPQIIKQNPDLLLRMKNEGHVIGNHTATHRDMSRVTDFDTFRKELADCEDALKTHTGLDMAHYYRPPEGRFSEKNLTFAEKCGYTTVFWDLAYADWDEQKQKAPSDALSLILSRTHPGTVALLHPTSSTNAAILGEYIDILRADGYTFRSLRDYGKKGST